MDNRDEHAHEDSPSQAPTAAAMEERYASSERVWSGDPNAALLHALAKMGPDAQVQPDATSPRTALDIGCGEGADAVWLAQQGWQVTAIDHAPHCCAPRAGIGGGKRRAARRPRGQFPRLRPGHV